MKTSTFLMIGLLSGLILSGCKKTTIKAQANTPKANALTKKPAASRKKPMTNDKKVLAVLDIDRVSGGKRSQLVTINTGSTTYLIAYRPQPQYYQYVEKKVLVEFETYEPEGQALSGQHARIISIELAPGETPYNPLPKALPAPPIVTTKKDLLARINKWVQFDAKIISHHAPPKNPNWLRVHIQGPEGIILRTIMAQSVFKRWQKAKKLTIVGMVGKPTTPETNYLKKQREVTDKALGAYELVVTNQDICDGLYIMSNVPLEGKTCIKFKQTKPPKFPPAKN